MLQGYWELVQADAQYKVSKALGQYVIFIIFLLGFLGNLLSFAVMVRKSMRASSTAFYMAALALADTMVLLVGCLRRWVVEVWNVDLLNDSAAACYIVNFLQYWSFSFAVWILVIMTIDRVIVVQNPLKAHLYATRRRAALSLFIVSLICAGINIHFFFTTTYDERLVCTAKREYLEFYRYVWSWVDATVYSFLPFVSLLVLNTLIIISLKRANERKRRLTHEFNTRRRNEQNNTVNPHKLTIMLLSITCAFIVLTAPAMVIHIIREKGEPFFDLNKPKDMAKYILTRQISRILLYLNHSVNFFLYCITGAKFRRELFLMIRCVSTRDLYRRSVSTSIKTIVQATVENEGINNLAMSHHNSCNSSDSNAINQIQQ